MTTDQAVEYVRTHYGPRYKVRPEGSKDKPVAAVRDAGTANYHLIIRRPPERVRIPEGD